MAMRLSGKTAFITGGTSGIGLATLEAFVEHGAMVGFTARRAEGVDAVIARLGKNCAGFVADAGDDEAMVAALAATSEASAGIDVVFANAGHYVHTPLGETSREALQQQLSVVTNTFMTVHLALPHLRRGASVILMGSAYATTGPHGAGAYAASKAGIAALARSFASELSPRGIRINVVVPGAVDTPSWGMDELEPSLREERKRLIGERAPLNRMIRAEEVAGAVLFLASDESSGIQATEIVVDGGTTGALAGSPRYLRGEP
jgi:NAD(P)-dependent dehydrogenase (short-subunit alcohol dehydrogenase family)